MSLAVNDCNTASSNRDKERIGPTVGVEYDGGCTVEKNILNSVQGIEIDNHNKVCGRDIGNVAIWMDLHTGASSIECAFGNGAEGLRVYDQQLSGEAVADVEVFVVRTEGDCLWTADRIYDFCNN